MTNLNFLSVLISVSRGQIQNVSRKDLLKFLHHYKYFCLTKDTDNLYVPLSRKNSNVGNNLSLIDGFIWDKKNEKVLKTLKFRFKTTQHRILSFTDLTKLKKKEAGVDILDIGFQYKKASLLNSENLKAFIYKDEKPQIIISDFSNLWEDRNVQFVQTCLHNIKKVRRNNALIEKLSQDFKAGVLKVSEI